MPYIDTPWRSMYSVIRRASMQEDYRPCVEKLAKAFPEEKNGAVAVLALQWKRETKGGV
jgi:hypothetical protein